MDATRAGLGKGDSPESLLTFSYGRSGSNLIWNTGDAILIVVGVTFFTISATPQLLGR